jgi:hypothetical protein
MGDIQQILLFLLLFTVVLALSYTGWVNFKPGLMAPGRWFYSVAMVASTLVVFVLAVALPSVSLGVKSVRDFGVRHIDLTVIAIMALGLVSGNGTSAGISEISVFLGFALGLGLLLSLPDSYGASRVLVSALSLSFILFLTNSKFRQPYAWWYVSEPDVQLSTTKSSVPLLAGFQLSPSAAKMFDDATEAIQSHSKPGDDVFVFPHVPGLYLLSERWPRSKVVVSWFDFLPDPLARAEADRLLATPPTVIVNLKIPDAAWEAHERLFREGRPLGQRAIRAAIEGLTKDGSFQLDLSREVSPGCTLEVWHRATPQVRSDKIAADNISNPHMARK